MLARKIAIVGAGSAGLAVLRQFCVPTIHNQQEKDEYRFEVTCFEQLSDVGGLWIYSDVITDVNHPVGSQYTAVYKSLITNLPHQIMAFTDFPFPKELPTYVGHEVVKDYLQSYSDHFNLKQFIQFNTRVIDIKPQIVIGHDDIWSVSVENVHSKIITKHTFDAIVICNGHFSTPNYPRIENLDKFSGKLEHSMVYRNAEDYKNKRVLIIGGGPSGVDIASEVCQFAEKSNNPQSVENDLKTTLTISDKAPPSTAHLTQNPNVRSIDNIDCIICCTGYLYSYPFLGSDSGVAVLGPAHVGPLYKDLISVRRPSLAFPGLQSSIIPFPLTECQAKFLKAHLSGKVKFPKTGKELDEVLSRDVEAKRASGVNIESDPHRTGVWQWQYMNELAALAGFEPPPSYYPALHAAVIKDRKESLQNYKSKEYKINEDGTFYEVL
ncbi:hypothetical protein HELRODRAFT_78719 [Helobdella robusta]|uniref:Flavin-containing monooxygenase n=1 Tax=Helobdella robusta TaxID=6412 RepID=T1G3E9_HELRO|nr:hypothetical protein HELRODRAFT_78719 [Helobdella robusta]ESO04646.1 hypothetical protein HELRODRAFT_78719 [Helobdella robusta]